MPTYCHIHNPCPEPNTALNFVYFCDACWDKYIIQDSGIPYYAELRDIVKRNKDKEFQQQEVINNGK